MATLLLSAPDLDDTFLPLGPMRQIARVGALTADSIEGEVDLGDGHWVFPHHFPGDPIFPGCLMVEAAGQLVAVWAWATGLRGKPRLVRSTSSFRRPVRPADGLLSLRADIRERRGMCFGAVELSVRETGVASVELVLAVV